MLTESVARRYAKALFDAAAAQKSADTVGHELKSFVRNLEEETRLQDLWFSAGFPAAEKKEMVRRCFPEFSALTLNFLFVLADKRRENTIGKCAQEYETLLFSFYNQIFVEAHVAVSMPEAVEEELRRILSKQLDKRIQLRIIEDASLLGGMILKIGDRILDGSLRTKLENLLQDLRNVPLPA